MRQGKIRDKRNWEINFRLICLKYFDDHRLKAHNKTFNKKNNEYCELTKAYLDKILEIFKQQKEKNNLIIRNSNHEINKNDEKVIRQLLERKYNSIWEKIEQFIDENNDNISWYQYKIKAKDRLITIINKKERIIYPIIFDLHHLLINVTRDNSIRKRNIYLKKEGFKWDLRLHHKKIEEEFLNKYNLP
ncbi:MAG: hypothetical protein HPPSJP_0970 [Candidatus Hepatoplasma scabrum]|nr:MAG: hypothetical protein HPPSJP_0970 [Candidatus Hepatoplasma sp.]